MGMWVEQSICIWIVLHCGMTHMQPPLSLHYVYVYNNSLVPVTIATKFTTPNSAGAGDGRVSLVC